jgi:hypothetical protein
VPPQKWLPFFCRLMMKGKSPATAGTPPTIEGMLTSSVCATGAAETTDRAARATMKDLVLMVDDWAGSAGLRLEAGRTEELRVLMLWSSGVVAILIGLTSSRRWVLGIAATFLSC